ncbi:MAG: DNA mismatch repair endonuclease MutL [Hydrogeniiclostridium sp.]
MPKIHVLDKHVAELIAAGEVVERPSSVIKEMVENSIDAGSTAVTVEIQRGGITYMRVTDNGCGIAREDIENAFLRHATSKVQEQEDLEKIGTLGFRGEALASIAAVARVEVMTRTQEDLAGTRYTIEGGEGTEPEDAGCAPGTTFIVRDLFYNTPARMKFLKKDVVEGNAVAAVMDRMALSHPEVSLRFLRDGKEVLHTPGDGKLKSAVYAVFGRDFISGLIPLEYDLQGVKVEGFVSKPAFARPNRSMQHFFINGRYVKSRTAMVALEEGFKGSLMVGKQPACVLHLHVAFEAVDVNVHPSKIEVRFINERPIFDAVYYGVKKALNEGDTPKVMNLKKVVPAVSPVFAKPDEGRQTVLRNRESFSASIPSEASRKPDRCGFPQGDSDPSAPKEGGSRSFALNDSGSFRLQKRENAGPAFQVKEEIFPEDFGVFGGRSVREEAAESEKAEELYAPKKESAEQAMPAACITPVVKSDSGGGVPCREEGEGPKPEESPASESYESQNGQQGLLPEETPVRLIGEAFGTYIILERGKDELLFIDKHAAHERMLYEKLKKDEDGTGMQMLLEPILVTLDKNEYAAVLEALPLFEKAGFEIEDFGSGTVLVRSAPMLLENEDVASSVMEMAGYLLGAKNDLHTEKLDWLYHNIACRAAVKAGDESSPMELAELALRLLRSPDIRYCPHGRPVSIRMKRRDLEKQFGRV